MKVAIIYFSISGNTEEMSEVIAERIELNGGTCDIYEAGTLPLSLEKYDIVLFGTFTWGKGKIPSIMRDVLRYILKEKRMKINKSAVFGTGDKTFPTYCKAVDETIYHLNKHGIDVIDNSLKIEQSCRGSQMDKVINWTDNIMQEVQ